MVLFIFYCLELLQSWILTLLKFLVGVDPRRQAIFFLLGFGQYKKVRC